MGTATEQSAGKLMTFTPTGRVVKEVKTKASSVQNKVEPSQQKTRAEAKIAGKSLPIQTTQKSGREARTKAPSTQKTVHKIESNINSMSGDDILSKLVKTSPVVKVMFGNTGVSCVLDTGAETSLILASFYNQHLKKTLGDPQTVGTYLQVYGANGMEIPIKGYVEIPLSLLGQNLTAYFLVVDDCSTGEALGRGKRAPVLIGCNIMHELKEVPIDKSRADADVWSTVLQWYRLTKVFPEERI